MGYEEGDDEEKMFFILFFFHFKFYWLVFVIWFYL